jgi:Ca-activated chloride channel homolog
MICRVSYGAFSILFLAMTAFAQGPMSLEARGTLTPDAVLSAGQMSMELWNGGNAAKNHSPLQEPSGSVSKLDLKAPAKARKEYSKGYQLLMQKDFTGAVEHLNAAIAIYPSFVAAHNALGSTYLDLGKNDEAREQFAKSVVLDDHLPTSYLNLGCAQLALKNYPAAEESIQKATNIAPLDLQFLTALVYAQLLNHDYRAAVATADLVHSRKHQEASIVHYYAAAAYEGQNNLQEAQHELNTLLKEDPKSPAADQARKILLELKTEPVKEARKTAPTPQVNLSIALKTGDASKQIQQELQESKEQEQVAEAEAACTTCDVKPSPVPVEADKSARPNDGKPSSPWTMRKSVDEVAVFFSATDHGKSVTDLTDKEVGVLDDRKAPAAILGFRNEAQLPLRMGLIIDTSASIEKRFSFEQRSATNFIEKAMTEKNDLAFVVGVASSVLLVQDFTGDQKQISHSISELAPGGGTAIWDAVAFAADKLASRQETQPVARILVIISDGFDNSSSATLKDVIEEAVRREVIVYTVSTRDVTTRNENNQLGDQALKLLAERTGGAAFVPGSLGFLNSSLGQLQEVIRSRYLISYKPAVFAHDGKYRAIDITARKSGQKLHVYARKGYYASVNAPAKTASD